jgi:translocation and assembly module TamB
VTLVGDLDPFLNFVARSAGSDITVFITVSGRVSDLDISFSSQPELPEDEVLARLIFNRGLSELSPLQIAQLAAAAAELAGGSNTSLLGSLRSATGLDDLDVVTDSEGNAAVRAGRYISDNIYLGVEAGAQGSTRGTINLDITEELKARGSVGSDGDSSLGVFYERDY